MLSLNLGVVNDSSKENIFQNLFGTYKYAHEYFSNKDYRFELDYWNQKWLIYRSIGVEAETHKRGWFWWNNINSDEIVLGINKVVLNYSSPKPDLSFLDPNYNKNMPIYIHDNSFKIKTGNVRYKPITIKVNNNVRIPFFKIRNTKILNIYINDNLQYNLLNDSNIKQLYRLGSDFLKRTLSTSTRKDFFVTMQKDLDDIQVVYFDEMKRVYNTDEIRTVFAENWSFMIGVSYADSGSGFSFSPVFTPALDYLGGYKYINVDIYGIARRGSEWRGLRLDVKEKKE